MIGRLAGRGAAVPAEATLDTLLRQDEAAFMRDLCALESDARRALLRQGAARQWCKTAKSHDCVEALMLLHSLAAQDDALEHLPSWGRSRAHLGAEGWRQGKPMMALLHVGAGAASVRQYQRRFAHAGGWQKLVDERCISPQAYTARFGVSLPALRRWCDIGVLTPGNFAAIVRGDAASVMQAVAAGEIQTADILERCTTVGEASQWARRFLHDGLAPCATWMAGRPDERALAGELALAGRLSVDAYLSCVPRPQEATMLALREAGHATAWHALRAGLLDAPEILGMVQNGTSPEAIVRCGPVAPALACRWVETGTLEKRAFVDATLAHWRACDPMPPYHYEAALQAWGPYLLLRNLAMPKSCDARRAYVARQLATHMWHRATPMSQIALADAAAKVSHSDTPTGVCTVCLESFAPQRSAAPLLGCDHPAVICQGCLVTYVEMSEEIYPVCIQPDCKKPVLPEDVLRAGGSTRLVGELARSAIRRQLEHSAVWWACPTRDCVGGTLLGVDVGKNYQCRVCDQVTFVRPPTVDWRRDASKIMRLVDGLQATGDCEGAPIRECPQCGVPTEHNGGCAHMTCRECNTHWNFRTGVFGAFAVAGAKDEQTYVPQAGLLVTAGLYDGVEPGLGLHAKVMLNAKRLQLMPTTQMAIVQARLPNRF